MYNDQIDLYNFVELGHYAPEEKWSYLSILFRSGIAYLTFLEGTSLAFKHAQANVTIPPKLN